MRASENPAPVSKAMAAGVNAKEALVRVSRAPLASLNANGANVPLTYAQEQPSLFDASCAPLSSPLKHGAEHRSKTHGAQGCENCPACLSSAAKRAQLSSPAQRAVTGTPAPVAKSILGARMSPLATRQDAHSLTSTSMDDIVERTVSRQSSLAYSTPRKPGEMQPLQELEVSAAGMVMPPLRFQPTHSSPSIPLTSSRVRMTPSSSSKSMEAVMAASDARRRRLSISHSRSGSVQASPAHEPTSYATASNPAYYLKTHPGKSPAALRAAKDKALIEELEPHALELVYASATPSKAAAKQTRYSEPSRLHVHRDEPAQTDAQKRQRSMSNIVAVEEAPRAKRKYTKRQSAGGKIINTDTVASFAQHRAAQLNVPGAQRPGAAPTGQARSYSTSDVSTASSNSVHQLVRSQSSSSLAGWANIGSQPDIVAPSMSQSFSAPESTWMDSVPEVKTDMMDDISFVQPPAPYRSYAEYYAAAGQQHDSLSYMLPTPPLTELTEKFDFATLSVPNLSVSRATSEISSNETYPHSRNRSRSPLLHARSRSPSATPSAGSKGDNATLTAAEVWTDLLERMASLTSRSHLVGSNDMRDLREKINAITKSVGGPYDPLRESLVPEMDDEAIMAAANIDYGLTFVYEDGKSASFGKGTKSFGPR
ncbi:hypothetical protein E5Q_02993 [Mixia osmundae IAM 14324]|uniref:Uncharacterized protein n=1 Tax=Mixia osmundae (strain CBS 9802 / IAM 14324 / JCM 22182 / KY 12970) TaxID=764103 RepID=G7E0G7_MIXOS|nr:hypothetical protein E5Q_02993 [Mixia osmundae IAM 14324]